MLDGVIVCIDGEHYPPVVKEAIQTIARNRPVVAAIFLGGMEKIETLDDIKDYYGIPIFFPKNITTIDSILPTILTQYPVKTVFDLSDDPVLDAKARMKLACSFLYHGVTYEGADFVLNPMSFPHIVKKPAISVFGSGKRVGKTAIAGYIARTLKSDGFTPCIVTMGRGGPEEPELVDGSSIEITPEFLLQIASQGQHAASDYWEDALTSRVWTIGCRRCGGGMAGMPYTDNVKQGVQLANDLPVDIVILEGSGPTIPPVAADICILVVGSNRPAYLTLDYLGPYRVKLANMVIITNCEPPSTNLEELQQFVASIKEINPTAKVVETIFRPLPLESIQDERVFFCTTASAESMENITPYIEDTFQCEVVGFSTNLSNRKLLEKDLNSAKGHYSTLLTELKAAAVDVVTKKALNEGQRIVYCDNVPIPLNVSLDTFSTSLVHLVNKFVSLTPKPSMDG